VTVNPGAVSAETILTVTNGASCRTVIYDAEETTGSTTLTVTGGITSADVGHFIYGSGIPAGATITSFTPPTTVVISAPATATSGVVLTIC
jgi:hypothetical protein